MATSSLPACSLQGKVDLRARLRIGFFVLASLLPLDGLWAGLVRAVVATAAAAATAKWTRRAPRKGQRNFVVEGKGGYFTRTCICGHRSAHVVLARRLAMARWDHSNLATGAVALAAAA